MIDLRFRPLERWIGLQTAEPTWGPFRASYPDTLEILERELKHLDAKDITIEAAFRPQEIRNDGWPRGGSNPMKPGVILSFQSKFGPMALPCDAFSDWRHNLRAIALHLHHLRAAGLYGIGTQGEQYRGWAQLPSVGQQAQFRTAHDAAEFIGKHAGILTETILNDPSRFEQARRQAARRLHPDVGGDAAAFHMLTEAVEVVRGYHHRYAEIG